MALPPPVQGEGARAGVEGWGLSCDSSWAPAQALMELEGLAATEQSVTELLGTLVCLVLASRVAIQDPACGCCVMHAQGWGWHLGQSRDRGTRRGAARLPPAPTPQPGVCFQSL